MRSLILISALAIPCIACGTPGSATGALRTQTLPAPQPVGETTGSSDPLSQLLQDAEQHWQQRHRPLELHGAIETWERALQADPSRADVWLRVSAAYHLLVTSQPGTDDEASPLSPAESRRRGRRAAERALSATLPEAPGADFSWTWAALEARGLNPEAAPALYWWLIHDGPERDPGGYAQSMWARHDRVQALRFCIQHAADHDGAGPLRELAALRAAGPLEGHQDIEESERLFRRALEIAPDRLANRVMFARHHAVRTQDRARFEQLLQEVLQVDLDATSQEDHVQQRLARELLARTGELFE